MCKIDWSQITIADDAMFSTVFSKPHLCRKLLELLLKVPVERVEVVERERTVMPEAGAHGIRMDVYVRDGTGRVFNVELQKVNEKNLLKRSRYYLSVNDMDCIEPGEDYELLRDSYVIFVCLFDPIGDGLPCYTLVPACRETGREQLDGATRLFVNTRAHAKCEDPRLAAFLCYLDTGNMVNDAFCMEVEREVQRTRELPEWRVRRMRLEAYIADKKREERECNAELHHALREAGRLDEYEGALLDHDLYLRMLEEFGIDSGGPSATGLPMVDD